MRKPISTRLHGVLDYLTIGASLALPRALGWSGPLARTVEAAAVTKLAYTLLSRHELAPLKILPMKAHLAMDALGGAALCALPFTVADQDDEFAEVLAALGLVDIAAASMTRRRMARDERAAPPFDADLEHRRMESQQAPQMQHAAAAAPAASAGYGADQQAPQVQTAAAHEGTAG